MQDKVISALMHIQHAVGQNRRVITGHSGGKDSVVIHDLVSKAVNAQEIYGTVHNCKPLLGTSGDPVAALTEVHLSTLKFLYTNVCQDWTVTFLYAKDMPAWLHENEIECQIDGSRVSEHDRAGKSSMFIVDGKPVSRLDMVPYVLNGIFGLNMCYPIWDWFDYDVFRYIDENNLEISKEYIENGEWEQYLQERDNFSAPC